MGMVNTTLDAEAARQWRAGMTLETLQSEMDEELQFPGFPNVWTQPIRNRLDMLLTGIKTPVGIKILGADLNDIERLGGEIEDARSPARHAQRLRRARGARLFRRHRRSTVTPSPPRADVGDVEEVIEAGDRRGRTSRGPIEGRERYPVNVRYQRDFRTLPDLERVLIKTPTGGRCRWRNWPITLTPGPAMIRDENGQLAGYVYVDTATSDIGGYVDRAKRAVADQVTLPAGYTLDGPASTSSRCARASGSSARPARVRVIFMLLYLTFHSVSEATIVMLSVVYAMTGGVILQWLLGYNFSVAVWVGYIALYGVAVQTGVVMVVYLHEALDRRLRRAARSTEHDILRGHGRRIRAAAAAEADDRQRRDGALVCRSSGARALAPT